MHSRYSQRRCNSHKLGEGTGEKASHCSGFDQSCKRPTAPTVRGTEGKQGDLKQRSMNQGDPKRGELKQGDPKQRNTTSFSRKTGSLGKLLSGDTGEDVMVLMVLLLLLWEGREDSQGTILVLLLFFLL